MSPSNIIATRVVLLKILDGMVEKGEFESIDSICHAYYLTTRYIKIEPNDQFCASLEKVEASGDSQVLARLGLLYTKGILVNQDFEKALMYLQPVTAEGEEKGVYHHGLAQLLLRRKAATHYARDALKLFKDALEGYWAHDYPEWVNNLGLISSAYNDIAEVYLKGRGGIGRDLNIAEEHWLKSTKIEAKKGSGKFFEDLSVADAHYNLSQLYLSKDYGKYNRKLGLTHLKRAHEMGSALATYELAILYMTEESRNLDKAKELIDKLIKQNPNKAKYYNILGAYLLLQEDTQENRDAAMAAFSIAAQLGNVAGVQNFQILQELLSSKAPKVGKIQATAQESEKDSRRKERNRDRRRKAAHKHQRAQQNRQKNGSATSSQSSALTPSVSNDRVRSSSSGVVESGGIALAAVNSAPSASTSVGIYAGAARPEPADVVSSPASVQTSALVPDSDFASSHFASSSSSALASSTASPSLLRFELPSPSFVPFRSPLTELGLDDGNDSSFYFSEDEGEDSSKVSKENRPENGQDASASAPSSAVSAAAGGTVAAKRDKPFRKNMKPHQFLRMIKTHFGDVSFNGGSFARAGKLFFHTPHKKSKTVTPGLIKKANTLLVRGDDEESKR